MMLFDSHIHSICSHDGRFTASEMALASIEKGLDGICITDHFDASVYDETYDFSHIKESIQGAKRASEEYKGKIEVTYGMELGDYIFGPEIAQKCLKSFDFDLILCSVHSKEVGRTVLEDFEGFTAFAKQTSREDNIFMKAYFDCVHNTILQKEIDFDSLAHLTYPVRYICSANKREFDLSKYYSKIKDILKTLIEKEKALEINTSCMNSDWRYTLPDFDIVKLYKDMGGTLITLGSDSHLTDRLGIGFEETIGFLKEIGIKEYHTYKGRKPVGISIV